jgi:hypothetical protein
MQRPRHFGCRRRPAAPLRVGLISLRSPCLTASGRLRMPLIDYRECRIATASYSDECGLSAERAYRAYEGMRRGFQPCMSFLVPIAAAAANRDCSFLFPGAFGVLATEAALATSTAASSGPISKAPGSAEEYY